MNTQICKENQIDLLRNFQQVADTLNNNNVELVKCKHNT